MADLYNRTPGCVELIPLIDRDGRNVMAVICKVTYEMLPGERLRIAAVQQPLTFTDIVGSGQTLARASDITDFKPSTDVLIEQPSGPMADHPAAGEVVDIELGPVRFAATAKEPWPFGAVPRAESPRKDYAGTYDRAWQDERFPLLPTDFDPRHNQAAPPSQVTPHPLAGDELLTIRNLYRHGEVLRTGLPGRTAVVAGNVRGCYFTEVATLDTVTLSSDEPTASLVWRVAVKPRQKVEEVRNIFVSMAFIRSTRELYGKP